jgi:peptidyl-tRNA hydrolase, PTH2 family
MSSEKEQTKQVIVMRKFKSLRTGKYCAQASHASIAFLTRQFYGMTAIISLTEEQYAWLESSFRKIVCYVDTDEALFDIYERALAAGLTAHLITDSGLTEFGGEPTRTAVAIGPHYDSKFSGITDNLPLF